MTQKYHYDIIVIGGGFAGIYAAWRLGRDGKKVALLESSNAIGGNLKSVKWKDFWVDNGTHNLDLRTSAGQLFYEDILGKKLNVFDDQQWACTLDKEWTYGFEMPDFSFEPSLAQNILEDMSFLKQQGKAEYIPNTYIEAYKTKYGEILYNQIKHMIAKYTGTKPDNFAIEAEKFMGMFSRVRLGNDDKMISLKEASEFWNERLGVSIACGDKRFLGLNNNKKFGYPASGGLTTLCHCATNRLGELKVDVITNCEVLSIDRVNGEFKVSSKDAGYFGEKVFWSLADATLCKVLGFENNLNEYSIPVGNCFVSFETDSSNILGPDYLHDWSLKRQPFRYNKQGIYSGQVKKDGKTFVVAEIPTHPAKIHTLIKSINPLNVWEDMKNVGFVKGDAIFSDFKIWSHPFVFAAPKVGWKPIYKAFFDQVALFSKDLHTIDFGYRGRLSFMNYYDKVLKNRLS